MQIFCVEWCKECGVIRFSVVFIFCNDLYNNATKIFGTEGVLRRRFENLEGKMVYTTRAKCSIYRASRVGVFFLKKVSSREDCAELAVGNVALYLTIALLAN